MPLSSSHHGHRHSGRVPVRHSISISTVCVCCPRHAAIMIILTLSRKRGRRQGRPLQLMLVMSIITMLLLRKGERRVPCAGGRGGEVRGHRHPRVRPRPRGGDGTVRERGGCGCGRAGGGSRVVVVGILLCALLLRSSCYSCHGGAFGGCPLGRVYPAIVPLPLPLPCSSSARAFHGIRGQG